MGIIKTAMMTGGGLYAINKLAKTVETRQSSRSPNPSTNNQWTEYRDCPTETRHGGYHARSPPPFLPQQRNRDLADANPRDYPQRGQYGYLSNDNVWTPLPLEYSNIRMGQQLGIPYPEQRRIALSTYPLRQQQLEFDYPSEPVTSKVKKFSNYDNSPMDMARVV